MIKKTICIKTAAKQVQRNKNSQDIIKESYEFRTKYGNPTTGVPKPQDLDWYVLGRLDQLYEKQDENFKLIITKLENFGKEKVNSKTFWKITGILFALIIALIVY